MRRSILLLLAAAMLVIAPAAGADTKTVQLTRSGFSPATTTITVGDTVTFHNADDQNHQVVADDGSFASPVLSPGQTYSVAFAKTGTFKYHDGLRTSRKGSVVVNGPPTQIAISAAAPAVTYGSSTTLSGTLSTKAASQTVTLSAQPTAGKLVAQADVATTDTAGAFQFGISPTIRTVYQVEMGTVKSAPLTVFVRPRVGFGRSGAFYTAKVTSDMQYGGHFVYVQRRNAVGTWRSLKKAYLSSASTARFKLTLPRGRSSLRIWLPATQAGVGYIESTSRTLSVFRSR